MSHFNQILWSLDNEISGRDFERLCVDLLVREGYQHINPLGGTKDHGRDAETRWWESDHGAQPLRVFQFSLQKKWEAKLRTDALKIAAHTPKTAQFVFVTSQAVTGQMQDKLRQQHKECYGWDLVIFGREWLRSRLSEFSPDLALKYRLASELASSISSCSAQIDLIESEEDWAVFDFGHNTPEMIRASITSATRREPHEVIHWYRMVKFESWQGNLDAALDAIRRTKSLVITDAHLELNLRLFEGAIKADLGLARRSRPLLIQALPDLEWAASAVGRAVDHFNLANAYGGLDRDKEAENCYIKALEIDQGYTNAFVNLATLYLNQGNNELGLATLEQALRINPRHLGALLTKANTLLLFEGKAMDAVAHFRSVDIASTGADNFPQYRYWYALALHAAGDDEAALAQVEIGLALRPDNRQLLEAKAGALSDLRKRDVKFEEQARLFMEFRVQAYPEDFGALTELTDIYQNRGEPGMAWQAIETNLALRKFDLKALVEKVGFSLVEMKAGFQHASEYQNFREHARLTDHCAMMCGAGLQTSREILPVLDYALMPLYARLINRMKQPNFDKLAQVLLFQETLSILSEIFPAFGSDWLCAGRPDSLEEQNKLILTGSLCLMDVITIELARIYGYVASWLDIPIVISDLSKVIDWADVQAGVMVELISRVGSEWSSLATTPIEH